MTFKDSGRSKYGQQRAKAQLDIFKARTMRSEGIRWREVDDLMFRAAVGIATGAGATISFSRANGGVGVMLKLYQGDFTAAEFAGSADELNELFAMIIEKWESDEAGLLPDFRKATEPEVLAAD